MHFYRVGIIGTLALLFLLPNAAPGQGKETGDAKAWFDKAMLLREAGDPHSGTAFRQAVQALDSYLTGTETNSGKLSRAYVLRARCYNFLGNNDQALFDLNEAIKLSPEDNETYYLRAFTHELMGHTELSMADLKAAAQKGNEKARGELQTKGIHY